MRISGSAIVLLTVLILWFWGNTTPIGITESIQKATINAPLTKQESAKFDTSKPILPVAWTEQAKTQGNSETNKFPSLSILTAYGLGLIALTISLINQAKPQLGYFHLDKQFCVLPNGP